MSLVSVRGLSSEAVANSYLTKSSSAIEVAGAQSIGVIASVIVEDPYQVDNFQFDEAIAIATHQDKYIKYTIDAVEHIFFLNVDDAGTLTDDEGVIVYPIAVDDEATPTTVATAFAAAINEASETIGYTAVRTGVNVVVTSTATGDRGTELARHGDFPAVFSSVLDGTATPEITGSLSLQASNDNVIWVSVGTSTTLTALEASANYALSIAPFSWKYVRTTLTMSEGYGGLSTQTLVTI